MIRATTIAIAAAALVGCSTTTQVREANQASMAQKRLISEATHNGLLGDTAGAPRGTAAHVEALAAQQRSRPVMRVATHPWIGGRMVPATNEDKLPLVFREPVELSFADMSARVSIEQVAARLTKLTGVPVRVQPDVFRPVPGPEGAPPPVLLPPSAALSRVPGGPLPAGMPPGGPMHAIAGGDSTLTGTAVKVAAKAQPETVSMAHPITVDAVDMRWKGSLQAFLNHVTDRLGLAWEYRDNTVVIMRFLTEYHEITAFPGDTQYEMSSGGSATGGGGGQGAQQNSTADLKVKEGGRMDTVVTIEKAVAQMIKAVPGSEVVRSDGSGRLVVKTTKEMQAQVRDFIRSENSAMLRQVQVQFDIYSVRTNDVDEAGIDWNVIFQSLSHGYIAGLSAPASLTGALAGGTTVQILNAAAAGPQARDTNRRFGDTRAIISLLNQVGVSAQHRPVSLLALNRQWARKAKLNTEGYLSETTPGTATANGVGIPGLKTERITTGDSYVAMPHILDNNTVMLKFGVSLSDLLGLFDVTSGAGQNMQKVQVPRVSAVSDQYTVALRAGEVMSITGLSRLVNTTDNRTLTENTPVGLGGSRRAEVAREHYLILVRPVLL